MLGDNARLLDLLDALVVVGEDDALELPVAVAVRVAVACVFSSLSRCSSSWRRRDDTVGEDSEGDAERPLREAEGEGRGEGDSDGCAAGEKGDAGTLPSDPATDTDWAWLREEKAEARREDGADSRPNDVDDTDSFPLRDSSAEGEETDSDGEEGMVIEDRPADEERDERAAPKEEEEVDGSPVSVMLAMGELRVDKEGLDSPERGGCSLVSMRIGRLDAS